MQDIPEVLKPLREFNRECSCGKTSYTGCHWRMLLRDEPIKRGFIRGDGFCSYCGTMVGEDDRGRPYRIRWAKIVEALAHRDRALEWLGATFAEYDDLACPERCCNECPRLTGDEELESPPCHEELTEDMPRKCWVLAALAATEEE